MSIPKTGSESQISPLPFTIPFCRFANCTLSTSLLALSNLNACCIFVNTPGSVTPHQFSSWSRLTLIPFVPYPHLISRVSNFALGSKWARSVSPVSSDGSHSLLSSIPASLSFFWRPMIAHDLSGYSPS